MNNLFYFFLKQYCRVGLRFYFKQWQVKGTENIPSGPVIFVPNHQNAFLDAILVTCSSKKNPWFMTRADVFKEPKASWILAKLKMLPVYRFRDGYHTLKQNEEVFKKCVEKLNSGESLLIFAEGSHSTRYQLRPLQKGIARIAYSVSNDAKLSVVPVGIQYESAGVFGSRVLVNFGKPVSIHEIKNEKSEREFQEQLLGKIKTQLHSLMLHIEDESYEEKLKYLESHRIYSNDLSTQLINDRDVLAGYHESGTFLKTGKQNGGLQKVLRIFNGINLYFSGLAIQFFLLNNIKDPQFTRSVKFAAGIFVVPFFLLLQALLMMYISGSSALSIVYVVLAAAPIYFNLDKR